jgi:thiol:disulfide interchange protein DsbD
MPDFTGYACELWKMENVWSDPKILPILNNEVILYVDDKQICQKTQQFIKTTGSR